MRPVLSILYRNWGVILEIFGYAIISKNGFILVSEALFFLI